MSKCSYCGGKLKFAALPKTVYVDPKRKSEEFAVVRMCLKCGRPHKPDVKKAGIPTIDELRKRNREKKG